MPPKHVEPTTAALTTTTTIGLNHRRVDLNERSTIDANRDFVNSDGPPAYGPPSIGTTPRATAPPRPATSPASRDLGVESHGGDQLAPPTSPTRPAQTSTVTIDQPSDVDQPPTLNLPRPQGRGESIDRADGGPWRPSTGNSMFPSSKTIKLLAVAASPPSSPSPPAPLDGDVGAPAGRPKAPGVAGLSYRYAMAPSGPMLLNDEGNGGYALFPPQKFRIY